VFKHNKAGVVCAEGDVSHTYFDEAKVVVQSDVIALRVGLLQERVVAVGQGIYWSHAVIKA
jgi:hypothetical protein